MFRNILRLNRVISYALLIEWFVIRLTLSERPHLPARC